MTWPVNCDWIAMWHVPWCNNLTAMWHIPQVLTCLPRQTWVTKSPAQSCSPCPSLSSSCLFSPSSKFYTPCYRWVDKSQVFYFADQFIFIYIAFNFTPPLTLFIIVYYCMATYFCVVTLHWTKRPKVWKPSLFEKRIAGCYEWFN